MQWHIRKWHFIWLTTIFQNNNHNYNSHTTKTINVHSSQSLTEKKRIKYLILEKAEKLSTVVDAILHLVYCQSQLNNVIRHTSTVCA